MLACREFLSDYSVCFIDSSTIYKDIQYASLYNSSHILPTTVLCNIKRLRIALEQYAVQQLIQNGNYRLELKQVSRFKITSNIVFTSFLLLTVSLIIDELLFAITTLLYFGKCYFPLIYGTAFEPILTTTNQQIILFQVNYYISRVNIILYLVSFLVVSIPLSIATLINVTGYSIIDLFVNQDKVQLRIFGSFD